MHKTREMMDATHKRFSDDDWEAHLYLHEDDYDGEEACDMCGLSGVHKMSCTLRYQGVSCTVETVHYGGYCIAGSNCMCAEETQRASCIDWKQQA